MRPLKPLFAIFLFMTVAVLALLPLGFVAIPPMVDYPNHLARCTVLSELSHSAVLQSMYEPRSVLLPNMAMDAVVVPLAHVMPAIAAGKVFCGLVLLLILSGAFALSVVLEKRAVLWSFAPALLLFNRTYTFGFLNYLFGIGLVLWGLACWIQMRDKPVAARLAAGSAFALILFFSHLVSMFLFGCALTGFEIARWLDARPRERRALWYVALQVGSLFVVPTLLLMASPTHTEASRYYPSTVLAKLGMVLGILRTDPNRLDLVYSVIVGAAFIALFATKTVRVDPRMRWAIAAVGLAFLLLPASFATCACVDIRIPIVAALLLVAGSRVVRPDTVMAKVAVGVLACAFLFRTVQVSRDWAESQRTSQQVLADLSRLPDKAVVFCAADVNTNLYNVRGWEPPLVHLPVAEMLSKPLFFTQFFALPTQHPLAIRPELRRLESFQETDPFGFEDARSLADVVNMCHEEADDRYAIPPSLGREPNFYLFAITEPGKREIGTYENARLIVRRPRYALFQITHTRLAAQSRWRTWIAQGRLKPPTKYTLRHVEPFFGPGVHPGFSDRAME